MALLRADDQGLAGDGDQVCESPHHMRRVPAVVATPPVENKWPERAIESWWTTGSRLVGSVRLIVGSLSRRGPRLGVGLVSRRPWPAVAAIRTHGSGRSVLTPPPGWLGKPKRSWRTTGRFASMSLLQRSTRSKRHPNRRPLRFRCGTGPPTQEGRSGAARTAGDALDDIEAPISELARGDVRRLVD